MDGKHRAYEFIWVNPTERAVQQLTTSLSNGLNVKYSLIEVTTHGISKSCIRGYVHYKMLIPVRDVMLLLNTWYVTPVVRVNQTEFYWQPYDKPLYTTHIEVGFPTTSYVSFGKWPPISEYFTTK